MARDNEKYKVLLVKISKQMAKAFNCKAVYEAHLLNKTNA